MTHQSVPFFEPVMTSVVRKLIDQLHLVETGSLANDPSLRMELITAAESMVMRLQTPTEFIQRFWQRQPTLLTCLGIADEVGLFKHLGSPEDATRTLDQLAGATAVEKPLLMRVLRHLAANGIIRTTAPECFAATHLSEALGCREQSSAIRQSFDLFYPAFLAMPKFLSQRGYTMPMDGYNTVVQQLWKLPDRSLFECFQEPHLKSVGDDFDRLIQSLAHGLCSWLDVCDIGALLQQRPVTSEHLFVDLGGGTGTEALALRRMYSETAGIVEVQDVHSVIENARFYVEESVVLRVHDFFQPQPVHSSRFYYMSSILHDWTDSDSKIILSHVGKAMTAGYSTLLLHEIVLPETDCHPIQSGVDIMMMTVLASRERSENDWRDLLNSAGFAVIEVHRTPASHKAVIECELL